ncbi:MAG TPA: lamin tail domain-containing protein, partial [Chroococcales cyanobacterium]
MISEVMWMGTDQSTADEWLEIAGAGSGSESALRTDIGGWTITSLKSSSEAVIARFETGTTIGSGEYLIVSNYPADQSRLAVQPVLSTTALSLPNTKLRLRLRDAQGAVMDEVDDGVGDPFAGSNPSGGPKASMERISLTGSGSDKSNWRTATATRGFDSGVLIYGTPGYANDASDPIEISSTASSVSYEQKSSSEISNQPYKSIKINEVLPNPTGSDTGEWIELFNSGSTALSLSGLTLTVDSASYTLRASALSGAIISSDSYFLLPKE